MRRSRVQPGTTVLVASAILALGAGPSAAQRPTSAEKLTPAELAKADSGRPPVTPTDIRFMQGMIHHHAQAIVMARWAPKNGARRDVAVLAARIDVAQSDEIAMMQRWLRERGETAPDPVAHMLEGHTIPGDTLMPGMLTAEQMKELGAARGSNFDRLFLNYMIQHHEGALTMTHTLFSTPGAGQETIVWKFASDVEADQSTEIDRMQKMLMTVPPPSTSEGRRP